MTIAELRQPATTTATSARAAAVLLALMLGSAIVIYGRLDGFLGQDVRAPFFAIIAGLSGLGVGLGLLQRQFWPALISISAVAYIFFNLFIFSSNFGTPLNLNAAFAFAPLASVSFFCWAGRKLGTESLLSALFAASTLYAIVYLVLSLALSLTPNSLPIAAREALVLGDGAGFRADARADRVVGYLTLIAFGWLTVLVRLRTRLTWGWLSLGALFAMCIVMANSRVYSVCLLIVSAIFVLSGKVRLTQTLCLGALLATAVGYAAALQAGYNPFVLFEYDGSGAARLRSFETARYWIGQFPIFGVGAAPSPQAEQYFVTGESFSLTDLGPVGILYGHGVVGLLLWLAMPILLRSRASARGTGGLELTLAVMIIYQIIAPVLWYGGGTMVFAIWLAAQYQTAPIHRTSEVLAGKYHAALPKSGAISRSQTP